MKFEVEAGGTTKEIHLERQADGRFLVSLNGETRTVDVQQTDAGFSLVFDDGRSLLATATPRTGGEWHVHLPHVDLPVVVDGQRHARRGSAGAAASGAQRITAPMPGRVVRVLVAVGDQVSHRQGLVVVEAMKMENELGAPKAGRVVEISVTEGLSVEAGRLLIVIE